MKKTNQSFEQLNEAAPLGFSPEQMVKLNLGIRERLSKKGLESYGVNILIVEDQDFSRKMLHDLLTRTCVYTCYSAKNAVEAIELYATHAPDIVLLDIGLPDHSGHEIAAVLKEVDPKSYIIYVTSSNFIKDVAAAKKNNVRGFIAKPYSKNKIQAAIDNYIALQTRW